MAADYPDWVMVHKKKGTYINRVDDRYYLYAAHSERIRGTGKGRRVSDGYPGRITREDGVIPADKKLKNDPEVFEVGLSYVIISSSVLIRHALQRSFPKYGKTYKAQDHKGMVWMMLGCAPRRSADTGMWRTGFTGILITVWMKMIIRPWIKQHSITTV